MPIYHLIFDTAQDIHDAAQTLHPTDVSLRQAFVDENLQARHRPIVENLKNYLEATHLSVYANKISVESDKIKDTRFFALLHKVTILLAHFR